MKKIPVRGMRDILPTSMTLREYLLHLISDEAEKSGFQKIQTPAIEHLENLSTGDGGENEKLIFKVLKRGESLNHALLDTDPSALKTNISDSALRYDLTVPLARFYADNSEKLPTPFKSLQIGSVWRADAPQKGRFREFTQCDMDIIGDQSILAEIDAIRTTIRILSRICTEAKISGLTIHLNDRRLLVAAAEKAGIPAKKLGLSLILLDKRDKIGEDGVRQEMLAESFDSDTIDRFLDLFKITDLDQFAANLDIDSAVVNDLKTIISAIDTNIVFDPTLVRGMGYYTGPIFEYTMDGLGSSVGGGGRYNGMIEKFTGKPVPACGSSIGFERILTILEDLNFTPPVSMEKIAVLISKNVPSERYAEIERELDQRRANGAVISILPMARNLGHQCAVLEENGYTKFEKIFE